MQPCNEPWDWSCSWSITEDKLCLSHEQCNNASIHFYLCNWKSYLMRSLGPPTFSSPSRVMSFEKMCMDAKINEVLQTHFKRPKRLHYKCVLPLSHWHCLIVAMRHEISPPFGNEPFLDSVNADVCEFTTKLLTLRYCTWPWSLTPLPRGAQKPWVQHERTKHERRHESMSNDSKFLKQISCKLNCSDEFSHESFCVVCVHRWVLIISWLSKIAYYFRYVNHSVGHFSLLSQTNGFM